MATRIRRKHDPSPTLVDGGELFGELQAAPRADLELREKNIRRGKIMRFVLIGSLLCVPVGMVAAVAATNKANSAQVEVDQLKRDGVADSGSGTDDPGKFAATSALQSWLDSVPAPLPGGQIMSWDGSSKEGGYDPTKVSRLSESFTVIDGAGRGYTATVEVAVDPRGGAQATTGPSLIPIPQAATDDWAGSAIWPGFTAVDQVPAPVSTALQSWASAYTSGNADELRQAVGDGDGTHTYLALSGITSVTSTAKAGLTTDQGLVVRAEVVPTWAGRSAGTGSPAPFVLDVLVTKANTAAPQVVAWGAPGTGPRLKPYMNAITVPVANLGTATAAPSASATSTHDTGGTAPATASTATSPSTAH